MIKEILFENDFILTQDLYLEFIKKTKSKIIQWFYIFSAIVLAIIGIYFFTLINRLEVIAFYISLIVLSMSAIFFTWSFIFDRVLGNKKYKQSLISNNTKMLEVNVRFNEDEIQVLSKNSGVKNIITYDMIKKLIISENLYIVFCKNNIGVLVKKNGFVLGNDIEFEEFITNKIK